jgi:hypothetical protein
LTEAGAKLKAMGYPRDIWLDLIYPALHPSVQSLLTGFAAENGSYDLLLNDCDRIERMSKSVCPTQQTFTVNALYVDPDRPKQTTLLQDSMVDQKLQKIEQTLAQISLNNTLNTKPKSFLFNNTSQQSGKSPIRCYFCSRVGHIKPGLDF